MRVAFYLFFGNLIALYMVLNLWEFVYEKGETYPDVVYTILDFYYDHPVWYIAPFILFLNDVLNLGPESFAQVSLVFIINAAVWALMVHTLLWLILRWNFPVWKSFRLPKE